jgi:hypothetical protein
MTEQTIRNSEDPFDVAFIYPNSRPRSLFDQSEHFLIGIVIQFVAIIATIGLLKRQHWAWSLTLALHLAAIFVHLETNVGLNRTGDFQLITQVEGCYGRYVSLIIGIVSLYLLNRKDLRIFLTHKNAS